jgi:hypothetical protein
MRIAEVRPPRDRLSIRLLQKIKAHSEPRARAVRGTTEAISRPLEMRRRRIVTLARNVISGFRMAL